jgi:hypothetical protein
MPITAPAATRGEHEQAPLLSSISPPAETPEAKNGFCDGRPGLRG